MKQFTRFLLVGIVNTFFGYAWIFGFMYLADFSPETSNVLGYAIGLVTSYVLNRHITFRSSNERKSEFVRFLGVFGISFTVNFVTLWVLLHVAEVADWAAQIFAGIAYVVTSYVLNKSFVFRRIGGKRSEPSHR